MPPARVTVAVLLLALAGAYACGTGLPMTWDGAYQFYYTLAEQRPYAYGTRLHSWLLWQPLVWLSGRTSNLTALTFAYGLPFALAPAASLLCSWWVVRRHAPGLVVWAAFGIAAAPLPGQAFVINDSIFQQHLFWPVFLGAFVPLSRTQRAVLALLALAQLSHPIGVLLLLIGAVTAGGVAWRDPARRRRASVTGACFAVLTVAAVGKLLMFPDNQAADEFHFLVAQNRWQKGVAGAPLVGLTWVWASALLLFFQARLNSKANPATPLRPVDPNGRRGRFSDHVFRGAMRRATCENVLGATSLGCSIISGAVWLNWATDEHQWAFALDYRRWLVPLTLPLFALCTIEGIRRKQARTHGLATRGHVTIALAATFAAVLCVQGALWDMLSRRLLQEALRYPGAAVPRSALPWIEGTPMQHWGTAAYLAVLQGRTPRRVLLYGPDDLAALRADPPGVPLVPWEPVTPAPGPRGWFDHRPLVEAARRERASDEGVK